MRAAKPPSGSQRVVATYRLLADAYTVSPLVITASASTAGSPRSTSIVEHREQVEAREHGRTANGAAGDRGAPHDPAVAPATGQRRRPPTDAACAADEARVAIAQLLVRHRPVRRRTSSAERRSRDHHARRRARQARADVHPVDRLRAHHPHVAGVGDVDLGEQHAGAPLGRRLANGGRRAHRRARNDQRAAPVQQKLAVRVGAERHGADQPRRLGPRVNRMQHVAGDREDVAPVCLDQIGLVDALLLNVGRRAVLVAALPRLGGRDRRRRRRRGTAAVVAPDRDQPGNDTPQRVVPGVADERGTRAERPQPGGRARRGSVLRRKAGQHNQHGEQKGAAPHQGVSLAPPPPHAGSPGSAEHATERNRPTPR